MRIEDRSVYEIIESELGLTEEEIDELFKQNKFLSYIISADIMQLIKFFEQFGITKEEMKEISIKNPYFLTENFERVRYIEDYLKMVDITDIRSMAVNHPISISQNPIDIKNFIEDNRKQGKKDEEIKEMLMKDFEKYFTL